MPQKNIPPDWLAYSLYVILTGLAGALGAFVYQIHGPIKNWTQRIAEWIGGALCAIYGAELAAQAILHILDKFDLVDKSYVMPDKIIGLAGFLCGALGVSIIDTAIKLIHNNKTDIK